MDPVELEESIKKLQEANDAAAAAAKSLAELTTPANPTAPESQ